FRRVNSDIRHRTIPRHQEQTVGTHRINDLSGFVEEAAITKKRIACLWINLSDNRIVTGNIEGAERSRDRPFHVNENWCQPVGRPEYGKGTLSRYLDDVVGWVEKTLSNMLFLFCAVDRPALFLDTVQKSVERLAVAGVSVIPDLNSATLY